MDAKVYRITYMLTDSGEWTEVRITEDIEAHGFHMDGNYACFWGEDYNNHTVRRNILKIDRIIPYDRCASTETGTQLCDDVRPDLQLDEGST